MRIFLLLISIFLFANSKAWSWQLEVIDANDKVIAVVTPKEKKAIYKVFRNTACEAFENVEVELNCKDATGGSSGATADCRDKTNNKSTALSINNPDKIEEVRVVRINCRDPKSKTIVKIKK